ncbi:MAG TPA: caspase family protein [Cyclobacteriaceae bacterium]|jgi:WD40 repeat protein|nr:caspase family protein [Cyclobacteriaceae bacterium]
MNTLHWRAALCNAFLLCGFCVAAQNIYLTPYKKINVSDKQITSISFSSDALTFAAADQKGNASLYNVNTGEQTGKIAAPAPALFHDFINDNKTFLLLDNAGRLTKYNIETKESSFSEFSKGLKVASLDPSQEYLTFLNKDNGLEIFDLAAGMTAGRIQKVAALDNAMFLGFDRFGQQLAAINKTGDAVTWNPLNQQLLRQLKLQSGDFEGSRSVIQSASTNSSGDLFLIGLQEVFIPKGGMQGRSQPERRNMIVAYDWLSGQEVKRVPLRYRADGMALGPGPMNVAYFSADTRTIELLNLDKAEVSSSVSVDEKPTSISLSDDNNFLAVGTVAGNVYLYEVVRNNPSEVKITRPVISRNIGDQVVKETSIKIEGLVDGNDKIAKVFVNGEPAQFDLSRSFSSDVKLTKGKNRINVSVQNTQGAITEKDFYLTCEPDAQQKGAIQPIIKGKRVALVIGNAAYASAAKLNNTVNDANSMANALKNLGFEVTKITDGNYEQMKTAIYSFGDQIQDVDVSLFYYAGHGLEVDGTNYLVPVDANIGSALDVKLKAIPMTGVLRTMEFANDEGLNMIILDACRNNPFPTGKRGGASGLAREQAPSGTLIAYATDPGSVASDGDKANGLYTGELVKQLNISQRIEDIFMNTRNQVEKLSNGSQRPWEEARLKGVFYLR